MIKEWSMLVSNRFFAPNELSGEYMSTTGLAASQELQNRWDALQTAEALPAPEGAEAPAADEAEEVAEADAEEALPGFCFEVYEGGDFFEYVLFIV